MMKIDVMVTMNRSSDEWTSGWNTVGVIVVLVGITAMVVCLMNVGAWDGK